MATLNLGRIKPVFRGAYAGGTAYVVDDIVTSGNETFICILASTGNATSNATYWTKLAAKGTDGTDVGTTITTQGDILYRDGSGLQRLAIGSANQILQVNSGANALEYTAKPEGKVKQLIYAYDTSDKSMSNVSSYTDVSGIAINITPTNASNKILLQGQFNFRSHDQYCHAKFVRRVGGSDASPAGWLGNASGSRVRGQFGNIYRQLGEGDSNTSGNIGFSFCDSDHNTTSQITYQLQFRFSSGNYTAYFGRSHSDGDNVGTGRAPSFSMTAMEVA